MEHNYFKCVKAILCTAVAGGVFVFASGKSFAGEPEYIKLKENKSFVFSAGIGYGIVNNPCKNCDDQSAIGGITISGALGYKINDKFKIEFGPSFWIERNDLLNKNVADSERPNNKRTIVTFTGSYIISKQIPLSVRLGGGAGLLNYTPEKTTVKTEEDKFSRTEIFKGFTGTFGISYELNLTPRLKLFPSLSLWYIHLENAAINYTSFVDYSKPMLTTDFRLNFNYNF